MKTVTRKDLLDTLLSVEPGLTSSENIQQSSCFVFKDGRVFTYNEEILCSAPCDIGVEGAVSAEPFISILQKMSEAEVTIEADKRQIKVKGPNKECGIKFDREVTLPVDQVPVPEKWRKLPDGFAEAIDLVQNCCSRSDLHFGLRCVHFTSKSIEACDNVQAARVEIVTGLSDEALMRREAAQHIGKAKVTKYAEDKNWLHFRSPNQRVISCRRYLEKYPDLNKVFASKGTPVQIPKGLADATEKAAIFTQSSKISVANQETVAVKLSPGKLRISGEGELGWYRETEKTDYKGKEMEFSISPAVLAKIAKEHQKASVSQERLFVTGETWKMVFMLFQNSKKKAE